MNILEFRECLKTLLLVYKQKYDYKEPVENKENSKADSLEVVKKINLVNVYPNRVSKVLGSMPSLKVSSPKF